MTGYIVTTGEGHLADGTLMELVDGATSAEARAHLANCDDCRERFGGLQRAAALLRTSLPDVPMPDIALRRSTPRRPWLIPVPIAAAATFVVLASAAAATPPVREWIRSRLAGAPPVLAPVSHPPAAPTSAKTAGIVASFVPTDTTLIIRVDRRQAAGAIVLDRGPGERISAQAIGGTSAEGLLVLPGQLHISNAMTSSADYRISVPLSIRVVRVIIDGREVAIVRGEFVRRRIDLR